MRDDEGQPDRQMLIPTMRRDQQGMPLRIVKQHQSTAPKDRTQAPDQSPRNERVSVDGEAQPINVTGERPGLFSRFVSWVPQLRGPACQRVCQTLSPTRVGHLRQKGIRVVISIRPLASGKPRLSIGGIPTQIPGARHSDGPKKEQREQEPLAQCR